MVKQVRSHLSTSNVILNLPVALSTSVEFYQHGIAILSHPSV